ncbi:hypothetical protein BV133_2735 [Blastochloris viridis]|uniref:Uncharacterized protein n=1 Tax=Blastochloris viridis TaxID=1079 RepID=A0A182D4N8_BLAVI|nr:hypothetical protein BV133_2735 [Blastochloris viridis]
MKTPSASSLRPAAAAAEVGPKARAFSAKGRSGFAKENATYQKLRTSDPIQVAQAGAARSLCNIAKERASYPLVGLS